MFGTAGVNVFTGVSDECAIIDYSGVKNVILGTFVVLHPQQRDL